MSQFEVLAEWRIRRIRPPKSKNEDETLKWALTSLGLEEDEQKVYLYVKSKDVATIEDLVKEFNIEEGKARLILDKLYTLGLVEKVGRAYYVKYPLGDAIIKRTLPRLIDVLKEIAKVESSFRTHYYGRLVEGIAFNSVASAIPMIAYLMDKGSVKVSVTGTHVYTGKTVELEGVVTSLNRDNRSFKLLVEGGKEVEVGDRSSKGVDVKASSVIVYEVGE
ncbi:MAG: hypothetical protein DRN04_17635 [Thermoprotei archaeon]|nr:MAG: hypothetical protein DRN04_17635 [Thermoprotei archaeon]